MEIVNKWNYDLYNIKNYVEEIKVESIRYVMVGLYSLYVIYKSRFWPIWIDKILVNA